MKAIVQHRFGGPDELRLEEVPEPRVERDEVLVRVRAASVGAWVWRTMYPDPLIMRLLGAGVGRPRRPIATSDIAGVVERVGSAVTDLAVGDAVYGECNGAFAELAAVSARALAPKPGGLTFAEAAAIPVAGSTALIGLRDHARLRAGQSVAIIGASGGVGTFAVQIARSIGAEVTAVCAADAFDLVRELGADHVIDHRRDDIGSTGVRYDSILQLAGTASPSSLRRSLTRSGTLVMSSGQGNHIVGPIGRIVCGLAQSPFVTQKVRAYVQMPDRENLVALTELVDRGELRSVIDRTYPLAEAANAIEHVHRGPTRGKTVLTI